MLQELQAGLVEKLPGTLANKQVVLMVDNAAPTDDGCSAPAAGQNYTDKIVLIRRGTCSFESRVS